MPRKIVPQKNKKGSAESARVTRVSEKKVPASGVAKKKGNVVAARRAKSVSAEKRTADTKGPQPWGTLTVGFVRFAGHPTVQRFVVLAEKGAVVGGMLLFMGSVLVGGYSVLRAEPLVPAPVTTQTNSHIAAEPALSQKDTRPDSINTTGDSDATGLLKSFAPRGTSATGGAPTLSGIIMGIINTLLGLLGVYFFALMLYAGWLWMNAQGESDPVEKAKKIFAESAIGLLIILSAQFVSFFALRQIIQVVTGQ